MSQIASAQAAHIIIVTTGKSPGVFVYIIDVYIMLIVPVSLKACGQLVRRLS
jgi:hypothetical protein